MINVIVKKDVALSLHTVFRIGGTARYFYEANSQEALIAAVDWAHSYNLPFFALGAGSNTLVSENGFNGLVIKPTYADAEILGNSIRVGAGAMMPKVAAIAGQHGLSGFEWAVGIPGTIGGSVRGNAGCYGKSMADVMDFVLAYNGIFHRIKKISHKDCAFSYRDSKFKQRPELVVLSAVISLTSAKPEIISEKIRDYAARRIKTQDIGQKCAGCIFKNIVWDSLAYPRRKKLLEDFPQIAQFKNQEYIPAGFLIDHFGLKGLQIGRASISVKHANFFVNNDCASADDIRGLINHCRELVHSKTGLTLEEEIHYLA